MENRNLIDWKVKTFKGSWNSSKMKDIVFTFQEYIQEHKVSNVVLKKPDVLRTSSGLEQLISEIRILCQRRNLRLSLISLKTLKSRYSEEKRFTKSQMIKQVVQNYPELYLEFNKEQKQKNRYYTKMFEAVALALYETQIKFSKNQA